MAISLASRFSFISLSRCKSKIVNEINNINGLPVLNSLNSRGLGRVSFIFSIWAILDLNDVFDDRITSDDEHDNDEILDVLLDVDDDLLSEVVEFEKVFVNTSSFSGFVHCSS